MYIQQYHDKSVLNKELNFHIPIKTGFGVILLLRTMEANSKIKIKSLFQSPRIRNVYKKSITCVSTNITKKIKMINLIFLEQMFMIFCPLVYMQFVILFPTWFLYCGRRILFCTCSFAYLVMSASVYFYIVTFHDNVRGPTSNI